MNLFAYKLFISPALVALATLAGRRWGDTATGLVAGLPIVAGPVLFFYAVEQGPVFAGQAAVATLLGMVSLCAFLLVYAWRSWAGGTALSSLCLGWVAFAAFTLLIDRILQDRFPTLLKALVYALAALYLGRRSLPPATEEPVDRGVSGAAAGAASAPPAAQAFREAHVPGPDAGRPAAAGPWDIPARMISAALLVLTLTALAHRLGPRLGGLLTPFPVASTVLAVFAHRQGGRAAVRAVLKGLFLSFNSLAMFCAVLAAMLAVGGLAPSFAAAILAAGLTQAFVLRRTFKNPSH